MAKAADKKADQPKNGTKRIFEFFESQSVTENKKKRTEGNSTKCDDDVILLNTNGQLEKIHCPICGQDIGHLEELTERTVHVERCLVEAHDDSAIETAQVPGALTGPSESTVVSASCSNDSASNITRIESTLTCNTVEVITNEGKQLVPTSTKKVAKSRPFPFYKVLKLGSQKIAVDAFNYGPIPGVKSFFLTHFHSDHYGGLCKSWNHGIIYCTPATSRLIQMYLKVDPNIIREIEINQWCVLNGVEILFLDANHCPGSAIILFSAPDYTILHTGDFRASEKQVTRLKSVMKNRPINSLYLDTTYLDSSHCFPSQDAVIAACAEYCVNFRKHGEARSRMPTIEKFFRPVNSECADKNTYNPLVLVGTYTIGKERLAMGIAEKLGTQIFTQQRKKDTLSALGDEYLDSLLGSDGFQCSVHLVNMRQLNWQSLQEYFQPLSKTFTHLIAFTPTGWTFKSRRSPSSPVEAPVFGQRELEKCRQIKGKVQLFKVPYSEHSSFLELKHFCTNLNIGRVIPTVNTYSSESRAKMSHYLDQWVRR